MAQASKLNNKAGTTLLMMALADSDVPKYSHFKKCSMDAALAQVY